MLLFVALWINSTLIKLLMIPTFWISQWPLSFFLWSYDVWFFDVTQKFRWRHLLSRNTWAHVTTTESLILWKHLIVSFRFSHECRWYLAGIRAEIKVMHNSAAGWLCLFPAACVNIVKQFYTWKRKSCCSFSFHTAAWRFDTRTSSESSWINIRVWW